MKKLCVFGLAAVWVALVVLWPRRSDITPPPTAENTSQASLESEEGLYEAPLTEAPFGLLGVNFYESTDGVKRWNIRSKFAELHRKDSYAFMKEVDADFFASTTGNQIVTRSNYGRSQMEKQKVELDGDVSIKSRRGYLFEMDKLDYDGNSHEFTTEDLVRMKGPDILKPAMFLRGTGLLGNIDTEHFYLKKNVSAQRQLHSTQWLKITSHAGEFFTEDERAVFTGKVHSTLPKTVIDSDLVELTVTSDKESIRASGNVVLKQRNSVGRAENAFMEVGSNQVILEGNASVNSKDNEVKGRRIVLYSDEDRIEVEGAEGKVSQ